MPSQKISRPATLISGVGSLVVFFISVTLAAAGFIVLLTATPRPRYVGILYLIASSLLTAYSANWWRSSLPGLLACGVLNGVYMIACGHGIGQSGRSTSLVVASSVTVALIVLAVLSGLASRQKDDLDAVDRLMFVIFLLGIGLAFADEKLAIAGVLASVLALLFLLWRHNIWRSLRC